jgi:hypothetical protein
MQTTSENRCFSSTNQDTTLKENSLSATITVLSIAGSNE